jgi:glycosyltransferase involved in cell wall biosynthesis
VNILQVVHRFWPNLAGTEVYTLSLAQALAHSHNVLVYYRDHASRLPGLQAVDDTVAGLPVRRVSLNLAGLKHNRYRQFISSYHNPEIEGDFAQTLDRFQPDIVHFQHLMYLSARLVEIARRRNIPVVITLHDFWFKCNNALLLRYSGEICHDNEGFRACADCATGQRRRPAALRWLMARILRERDQLLRQALRRAQVVIAPSQFLKDQFVGDGYLPDTAIQVVENGIDTTGVLPHRERSQGEAVRFAYIGSIAPHKGVHILVQAFNQVQGRAHLEVYGDLEANPGYVAELRQKMTHPAISLQGWLTRQDVWRVLSEIDMLVTPSLWYENSPVIIQEAFAAGVPVIGSDLGGVAEKVQDGVNGLLFPTGDGPALRMTLQRVVDDPGQIERMRRQIRPVMSAAENTRNIEAIYTELCYQRRDKVWDSPQRVANLS